MKNIKNLKEKSEYSVQAVHNAIKVLEELGTAEHEQSIHELSEKLGLTKSNVLKLLSTLRLFGYVDENNYTGNFRLGVRTFQISQTYISKLNLSSVSQKIQEDLAKQLNESVYIAVLRKENVVYLNVVESQQAVRVIPRIGNIGPAYATATGKIQLAYLEQRVVEELYPSEFKQYTTNTIKSLKELIDKLLIIKEQGYAIDDEEYEYGIRCVALPVYDFTRSVVAALSVTAPKERLEDDRINSILPKIQQAAALLSFKFGYQK